MSCQVKFETNAAGLFVVADVFGKAGTLLVFNFFQRLYLFNLVCIINREYSTGSGLF